jgi:hypothetical protein
MKNALLCLWDEKRHASTERAKSLGKNPEKFAIQK